MTDEIYLTGKAAAARLGLSIRQFYKLVKLGHLPPRVPGTYLWDWRQIQEWRNPAHRGDNSVITDET